MQRILEIARSQLEAQGATGLSLREVARELGMVSSAVYRYVAGRDQLLTLLLVDAFEDLAAAVDATLGTGEDLAPGTDGSDREPASSDSTASARRTRERLLDLALAMRSWAVAHQAQWTLLYGTPVAQYRAPAEATTHPGTRVIGRVLEIVVAAGDSREADAAPLAPTQVPAELAELLGETATELSSPGATTTQLLATATFFSGVVGAINAELFTQWGPQFECHGAELFTAQARLLTRAVVA